MDQEQNILNVEFPRGMRGYSVSAVDQFMSDFGERLRVMQAKLEEHESETSRLRSELEEAAAKLQAYQEKENALASAMVALEQRKISVERELDADRSRARNQANDILESAKSDADNLLADTERKAAEMIEDAQGKCEAEEQRYTQLCASYAHMADQIRRAIETQLALLPPEEENGSISVSAITRTSSEAMAQAA
jgi:DivIVA domain-containing protein